MGGHERGLSCMACAGWLSRTMCVAMEGTRLFCMPVNTQGTVGSEALGGGLYMGS